MTSPSANITKKAFFPCADWGRFPQIAFFREGEKVIVQVTKEDSSQQIWHLRDTKSNTSTSNGQSMTCGGGCERWKNIHLTFEGTTEQDNRLKISASILYDSENGSSWDFPTTGPIHIEEAALNKEKLLSRES